MQAENVTRRVTLVAQGKVADNFRTRFKGLMGVRNLPAGEGLLIRPCSSVHCMFMAIPIDVVYLGRGGDVVGIDHELKPWRIGHIYRGAHEVLELPAGTARQTGTQVGDKIRVAV